MIEGADEIIINFTDGTKLKVVKILGRPDVQKVFDALGFAVIGDSPQEATARTRAELTKWTKVIRAANLQRQEGSEPR